MHKDVTLATVFDLFLEYLSGSVEELKTASRRCGESRRKNWFKPGCCMTSQQLPETHYSSKPSSVSAVKVILPMKTYDK